MPLDTNERVDESLRTYYVRCYKHMLVTGRNKLNQLIQLIPKIVDKGHTHTEKYSQQRFVLLLLSICRSRSAGYR